MTRIRVVGRMLGIFIAGALLLSSTSVLAKKKKKKDAQESGEFQPEEAPTGDQASKVLERAFKLYDGEDYYSASIELNKAIEGESGDTEPNKQKAEFWMGKALYNIRARARAARRRAPSRTRRR